MQSFRQMREEFPRTFLVGLTGLVVGFGLVVVFTLPIDKTGVALAAGCLFALSALITGGFLGFLFGIPRTNTAEGVAATGAPSIMVRPNTNLEQISDWLTKILVGVTLTQLPTIGEALGRLIDTLGVALGDQVYSPVFAGAILVYFSVFGFIAGWLLTSLRLPRAIQEAGSPAVKLLEAAQLSAAGHTEQAKAKAEEAVQALAETPATSADTSTPTTPSRPPAPPPTATTPPSR